MRGRSAALGPGFRLTLIRATSDAGYACLAVKLRFDADVLAAYRKTHAGWQTRINADLPKARKLKAG